MKTREELIQRLRTDPEFRQKFQSCRHGEELLEFVKHAGYDFTREQVQTGQEKDGNPPVSVGSRGYELRLESPPAKAKFEADP